MLGLLGKKIGMTRIFDEVGDSIPVTVVEAGPCTVIQKKTVGKEGYDAIQVGFGQKKDKHVNKPMAGHFKKAGKGNFAHLAEFKPIKPEEWEVGKVLDTNLFKKGDIIQVSGLTKGRGFQGVIKRHGHHGGPAAHGSKFHRTTGSIGMNTDPHRVLPGRPMPGHMGDEKITTKNLKIVEIDTEKNLLFIRGAVPGANSGLVVISTRAM